MQKEDIPLIEKEILTPKEAKQILKQLDCLPKIWPFYKKEAQKLNGKTGIHLILSLIEIAEGKEPKIFVDVYNQTRQKIKQ